MRKSGKVLKPVSLDTIALETGTDKSSAGHGYAQYYDYLFSGMRDKHLKLLEIGVQEGKSIAMWERYFLKAEIFGVDIDENCRLIPHDEGRTRLFCLSQTDIESLEDSVIPHGPYDIIIDDGSHKQRDQQKTFSYLFPYGLKKGGMYIIEDLNCSYERYFGGGLLDPNSTVEFIKKQIDELQCHMWGGTNPFSIDSLQFIHDAVIIRKKL